MLNLEQIAQIDRETLWLEITDADLQIAEPSPQFYSTALPAVTRYTFLSLAYLLTSFHSLGCTS